MRRLLLRRQIGLVLAALLALVGEVQPARAQFADEQAAAKALPADQTVNLFARWEGRTGIDGVFIKLPAGWRLETAVALRYGAERVPVEVRESRRGGGEYFVGAGRTLRSTHTFVFRVHTGPSPGSATWTLTPFTYRAEKKLRRLTRYRVRRRTDLKRRAEVDGNHVLSFQPQAQPLLLRRTAVPSLDADAPYTVAAWIKTTGLGEVVLSTWNGLESQPYPLEIFIDPAGRLRYYRGRPGHHTSMTSPRPIADGTWHHLTVVHDPKAAQTRLFLDGAPVDSLRDAAPLASDLHAVALGGRVPLPRRASAEAPPSRTFTGQLDEVEIRPQARTARAVKAALRRSRSASGRPSGVAPSPGGERGPVRLDFEGRRPLALLLQEGERRETQPRAGAGWDADGRRRVRSPLGFSVSLSDLSAQAGEKAVALSWRAPDRGTFVIERSSDGTHFRAVGRRTARDGRQRYAFTDNSPTGEVLFYRVRQRFKDGTERLSDALKVGRGGTEEKAGSTLMGNFPNPFSASTTIAYKVAGKDTPVRLSVWDLTGKRVATLVNESQGPGYHEVTYQPDDLSSGTYLLRLRVGGEQKTHKMVLVK